VCRAAAGARGVWRLQMYSMGRMCRQHLVGGVLALSFCCVCGLVVVAPVRKSMCTRRVTKGSPCLYCCRYTHRAARTAAGTAAEMARQLVQGTADNGIALVRPLGHSAGEQSGGLLQESGSDTHCALCKMLHCMIRTVWVISWSWTGARVGMHLYCWAAVRGMVKTRLCWHVL
jgi:hypothetical protein